MNGNKLDQLIWMLMGVVSFLSGALFVYLVVSGP